MGDLKDAKCFFQQAAMIQAKAATEEEGGRSKWTERARKRRDVPLLIDGKKWSKFQQSLLSFPTGLSSVATTSDVLLNKALLAFAEGDFTMANVHLDKIIAIEQKRQTE